MLYRELQPATWGVYHFILERKNHKTQKFFWKIKNIAEETGLNYRSVQRAEKELESAGVIKFVKRYAHCKEYKFIKKILLAESDQSSMSDHTGHPCPITLDTHVHSLNTKNATQTLYPSTSSTGQKVGEQYLLTNTINNNINKDMQSYNILLREFGKEKVVVAIENVRKLNGDVNSFWGYVRWSCKTGITPTNKASLQEELKEKHVKFVDDEAEKMRIEQEEKERLFAESDPESANKAIAEFISIIGKVDKKCT